MLYGVIDIGSNTVRMNIYSFTDNETKLIFSEKNTLGLVSYIENKKLSDMGIKKLIKVLKGMKKDLNTLNINNYNFFSTAVLRNVENTEEVLECIDEKLAIDIDVLKSDVEAELSFLGAKSEFNQKNGVLFDVGGGSSEIIIFKANKIVEKFSMPIGSLLMFNEYVSHMLPNSKEKVKIQKRVFSELNKLDIKNKDEIPFMCGVGGSIRVIKKILLELNLLNSNDDSIPVTLLNDLEKELANNDRSSYDKILRVKPARIHTLVPGLIIINTIALYFGSENIQVSKCGVREGFLYKNVLNDVLEEYAISK